jgi:hypothetical protein
MHCFTETREVAADALDLGFHISFSGIVSFKNAEALRDVARFVPSDRLLGKPMPLTLPRCLSGEDQSARLRPPRGTGRCRCAR